MNRKQRRQQQTVAEDRWVKENARIWKLVEAVRNAEPGWTVPMSAKDRDTVHWLIECEKQREEEEKRKEEDYDYESEEDEEQCRGCGSGSTDVFGCCSMRCAKNADQYD
jgi:hypothetical protein